MELPLSVCRIQPKRCTLTRPNPRPWRYTTGTALGSVKPFSGVHPDGMRTRYLPSVYRPHSAHSLNAALAVEVDAVGRVEVVAEVIIDRVCN